MEAKLKHLEFIEAVISRMSTSSFLFKGWAITIVAALSGFAAVESKRGLVLIALVTTLMFWGLDGYYLWLERCFVKLYNTTAAKSESEINFSMVPEKPSSLPAKGREWFATCWRPHLWLFYGSMLTVDLLAICLIRRH
jgi:hypothetical protein